MTRLTRVTRRNFPAHFPLGFCIVGRSSMVTGRWQAATMERWQLEGTCMQFDKEDGKRSEEEEGKKESRSTIMGRL